MAIAFDSVATATAGTATSKTYSHIVSSNAGGIIVVQPSWNEGGNVSGVTYAGAACTQVPSAFVSNGGANEVDMWYRLTPATGANNVVCTMAANAGDLGCGSIAYTGVNQTSPLGTAVTNTGTSTGPTVNTTADAEDIVVAVVSADNDTSVAGGASNNTGRWETFTDSFKGTYHGGAESTGSANPTMSWTTNKNDTWAVSAVPLKVAGGGGGGSILPLVAADMANIADMRGMRG